MKRTRRRTRTVLAHPLVGQSPRRSVVGVVFGTVATVLVVLADRLLRMVPSTPGAWWVDTVVDGVAGVAILLAALGVVAGVGYGAWNGGPALAGALPVFPVVVASLLSGTLVLDVDLAVVIAAGGLGAAVATLRETDRAGRPRLDSLGIATGLTVLACLAAIQFVPAQPPHIEWAVRTLAVLAGLAGVTVVVLWARALRDG